MRNLDFNSWRTLLASLLGLIFVSLLGVGIRLLAMQAIQQKRERANRQINERLRTLIAAYKTLGGSFTGALQVDPRHLRDLRETDDYAAAAGDDRPRRMRDAVEAALSDIILLGTAEQVRLAARAAGELAAGRRVETHDLVVSLRNFIREALDLDPVPAGTLIPKQGPARPSSSGGKGRGEDKAGRDKSGGGGMGGMMGGLGAGVGAGAGMAQGIGPGTGSDTDAAPDDERDHY